MAPVLRTDAGPLSYVVSGPTGSGHPDLVLVHGWCCDRTTLAPLRERLERRHRVVCLDLRGHGGSRQDDDDGSAGVGLERADLDVEIPAPLRDVTIEDYADDVLDIVQDAGLRSPVVVGHSMGGLVALATAARPPSASRPAGAVLLDPAPVVNPRAKAFWTDTAAPAVAHDWSGQWRRAFADALFLPTDSVDRDRLVELFSAPDPRTAAAAARAMGVFDGAGALAALEVPVLVVHAATVEKGLRDHVRDPSLLTTGQTVGAGHFHQLEVPDQLEPMIERWLAVTGLDVSR